MMPSIISAKARRQNPLRWNSKLSTETGKANPASLAKIDREKSNAGRAAPGAGRMLPRFGCHHKPPQAHTRGHGFSNITAVPAIPQGHSLGNGCHICVRN
jgi:hypothetical protein